jgi:hypothetical protein
MNDDRLGKYITCMEGVLAVACAKTERYHDLVVELILRSRAGEDLCSLANIEELRTAKTLAGSVTLNALNDISNTMLSGVLGGCLLVVESGSVGGKAKYTHNPEFEDEIKKACESTFSEIPNADNEESFQRAYGAWDVKKDTAVANPVQAYAVRREGPEVGMIKALYFDFQGDEGIGLAGVLSPKFVDRAKEVLGVTETQVRAALASYLLQSMQESERDFIRIASGGTTTAMAFEKKIRAIFQDDFSIEAYHSGQQKPRGRLIGGFADVLLLFRSRNGCVILDAKSTPQYAFPASDCRAMKDYCAYFADMPDVPSGCGLIAAGFVSCSFSASAPDRLREVSSNVGVPVFALTAETLLSWIKSGRRGEQILDLMVSLAPV